MCYLACKFQIAPTFSISGRKNVFINLHNILYPYCCSNHVVYGFDVKPPKQHDLNIYFYEFQLQWFAKSWRGWPTKMIHAPITFQSEDWRGQNMNWKCSCVHKFFSNEQQSTLWTKTTRFLHFFLFYEFTSSDLQIFYTLA